MPSAILLHELLEELLFIADKCTAIARHFRTIDAFSTLIQEKIDDKNPRFVRDFKTFADVLIQQVTVYWLELKFVGLSKSIYGEEDNHFKLPTDETIIIRIANDRAQLHAHFQRILIVRNNNNDPEDDPNIAEFIDVLIELIYRPNGSLKQDLIHQARSILSEETSPSLELNRIALWIDPIDSTSEYIRGKSPSDILEKSGLHCVTCLFGVFDKFTGLPILGVLSQPFNSSSNKPTIVWGYSYGKKQFNNLKTKNIFEESQKNLPIVVGKNETDELKNRINKLAPTFYVSGAGYKLFLVIEDRCQALVTSSKTTYFWDTCAAHAILLSLGGGIVPFDSFTNQEYSGLDGDWDWNDLLRLQIRYKGKDEAVKFNNSNGLVAYSSVNVFNKIFKALRP